MSTQFPGTHSVQIYERDADLVTSVGGMLASSLSFGDSTLVVATREHRERIACELESLGIDVQACIEEKRYVALDAVEVMSSVMREGLPERELFDTNFGSVLEQVRQHAQNHNRGLTVYGECVALLWDQGRKQAALSLEEFWQDMFREDSTFHLHCAYPSSVFTDSSEISLVHNLHTHRFHSSPLS
jgi:KaiC/GvpD/RAD55 family RecA-like ATPase